MNEHFINNFRLYKETYLDNNRHGYLEVGNEKNVFLKSDKTYLSLLILKSKIKQLKLKKRYTNIEVIDSEYLKNVYIEFRVTDPELYKYFFAIISDFLDFTIVKKEALNFSLLAALENMNAISRQDLDISRSSEIGLFGELFILNDLLKKNDNFIENWHGHDWNRHDFVFENIAFEVKTTTQTQRIHTIHGLQQLEPRDKTFIEIISIQLDIGNGQSILALYKEILNKLQPSSQNQFKLHCIKCGLDEDRYVECPTRTYSIRGEIRVYPVTKDFPSLTRKKIDRITLSDQTGVKLINADYTLDFGSSKKYHTYKKTFKDL